MPDFNLILNTDKDSKGNLLDFCGAMRIVFFRTQPYRYAGSFDYEKQYLKVYLEDNLSVIATVTKETDIVGFGTGAPFKTLAQYFGDIAVKYEHRGIEVDEIFYLGEVIIMPDYKLLGLARRVVLEIENHAKSLGYKFLTLCTAIYGLNNSPIAELGEFYLKQEESLSHLGFENTNIVISNVYPTVNSDQSFSNSTHQMLFWIKQI